MDIGKLDQIISIMHQTGTPDGYGGETITWSELGKAYAHIKPLRGVESEDRGAVRETGLYMFTLHRRTDLTSDMVFDWEGTRYNIRNIKKPTAREPFMQVIAEYGVATD